MKKNMKNLTALVMLLGAGFVFAQQGVIKEITGTVELKPAGAASFVAAKAGDQVAPNTIISTSFKSTAVVAVGSATLTIKPLTRLSLTEIQQMQGSEHLNVILQSGRITADVKPPPNTKIDMSVRSPTVTASVRGTVFEFDTMTLRVIEGTVAYSGNDGGIMLVSTGGTSQIDTVTGRTADPIETGAAALVPPAPGGAKETAGGAGTTITGIGTVGQPDNRIDYTMEFVF
jgi:hypothetical protein